MNDKRQARCEIITYLCGDEDLSPEFIKLLKAGGLKEEDGKIIREKLTEQIDSNYNFDLLFNDYYLEQLESRDDYPYEEMEEYTSDRQYRRLLDRHFPQSVEEACDILIGMLDEEEISYVKGFGKSSFARMQHFGLGLFIRNHFGINQGLSTSLNCDILRKSDRRLYMSDNKSSFLLEELWEEIQRRY